MRAVSSSLGDPCTGSEKASGFYVMAARLSMERWEAAYRERKVNAVLVLGMRTAEATATALFTKLVEFDRCQSKRAR